MLDIKLIRKNPQAIEEKLKTKDPEASLSLVLKLEKEVREKKRALLQKMKATRNDISQKIGLLKREGKDCSELLSQVAGFAGEIHYLDDQIRGIEEAFIQELAKLPNIPMDGVKISQDVKDNVLLTEWGRKREFDFEPKNHVEFE